MHKYIYIATTTLALGSASLFAGTVEDGYYSEYGDYEKNSTKNQLPKSTLNDPTFDQQIILRGGSTQDVIQMGGTWGKIYAEYYYYNKIKKDNKTVDIFMINFIPKEKYKPILNRFRTKSPTNVTSVVSSIASSPTQDSNLLNQVLLNINSLKHLDPNADNNLNTNVDDINISLVEEYSGDRKSSSGDLSVCSTTDYTSSESSSGVEESKNTQGKINILVSTLEPLPEGVESPISARSKSNLNMPIKLTRSKSTGQ